MERKVEPEGGQLLSLAFANPFAFRIRYLYPLVFALIVEKTFPVVLMTLIIFVLFQRKYSFGSHFKCSLLVE
jgi:hypothetical protein